MQYAKLMKSALKKNISSGEKGWDGVGGDDTNRRLR